MLPIVFLLILLPAATGFPGFSPFCPDGDFLCSGLCFPGEFKCDNVVDCQDGSDEADCSYLHTCEAGEFMCRSSECISASKKCNGEEDCSDGSDELGCKEFRELKEMAETYTHNTIVAILFIFTFFVFCAIVLTCYGDWYVRVRFVAFFNRFRNHVRSPPSSSASLNKTQSTTNVSAFQNPLYNQDGVSSLVRYQTVAPEEDSELTSARNIMAFNDPVYPLDSPLVRTTLEGNVDRTFNFYNA